MLAPNAPFERLYVKLEASPFGPWLDAAGGKLRVPDGPGLGITPDLDALAHDALTRVDLTATAAAAQ